MPNNQEHNKICKDGGYDEELCRRINQWMDKPALQFPGCQHRNFRHSKNDCDFVARQIFKRKNNLTRVIEAKQICMLHRLVDKKADKGCGCKPLFEDY